MRFTAVMTQGDKTMLVWLRRKMTLTRARFALAGTGLEREGRTNDRLGAPGPRPDDPLRGGTVSLGDAGPGLRVVVRLPLVPGVAR